MNLDARTASVSACRGGGSWWFPSFPLPLISQLSVPFLHFSSSSLYLRRGRQVPPCRVTLEGRKAPCREGLGEQRQGFIGEALLSVSLAGPCPASAELVEQEAPARSRGCAARSDFLAGSPVICDCHGKWSLFLPPSLSPNSSPRLPSASRSHTHAHTHALFCQKPSSAPLLS